MRQLAMVLSGVTLYWATGCYMPIGPDSGQATTSARPRAVSPRTEERSNIANVGDARRLIVRGQAIDAAEMGRQLREELAARQQSLPPDEYRAFVERLAARWITEKVTDVLVYHQAELRVSEEMGPRIDAYVDAEIRKVVTAEYGGVQRRYERNLQSRGRTLEDEREKIRREAVISSYLDTEIRPRIAEPTRAELLAAFEANREKWHRPARRSMSLIDVRVLDRLAPDEDSPSRETMAAARAEARSTILTAQAELGNGGSFEEVARKYSDGLHAEEGGSWGWVSREGVRERFEPAVDALYRLEAGQVSEVIETDDAFFLVRCDEVDAGSEPNFEDVQPELKERHFAASYNKVLGELVAKLRRQARIDPAELERFHATVVDATPSQSRSEGS